MTNPDEIQGAMMATSRRLQALIDAHDAIVETESDAIRLCEMAESTAYLASSGTVAEREAHVTKACLEERHAARLAKARREKSKLGIQATMAQLSALQSLASAMREEARLARVGDGP